MCRFATWAAPRPMTLADIVAEETIARISHLSTVHSHGWGAAWRAADGTLRSHRSILAAHEDPGFAAFTTRVAATLAVVHLRLGTPGYGGGLRNVHPFSHADDLFVHNGAITPKERIAELDPGAGEPLTSDTDSERYFRGLQAAAARHDGDVAEGMADIRAVVARAELTATSLNAVLLRPDGMHVISCHDPSIPLGETRVWPDDELGRGVEWPPYLPLQHLRRDDVHVVTSSGMLALEAPVGELPNHVVWTAPSTGVAPSLRPIPLRATVS